MASVNQKEDVSAQELDINSMMNTVRKSASVKAKDLIRDRFHFREALTGFTVTLALGEIAACLEILKNRETDRKNDIHDALSGSLNLIVVFMNAIKENKLFEEFEKYYSLMVIQINKLAEIFSRLLPKPLFKLLIMRYNYLFFTKETIDKGTSPSDDDKDSGYGTELSSEHSTECLMAIRFRSSGGRKKDFKDSFYLDFEDFSTISSQDTLTIIFECLNNMAAYENKTISNCIHLEDSEKIEDLCIKYEGMLNFIQNRFENISGAEPGIRLYDRMHYDAAL